MRGRCFGCLDTRYLDMNCVILVTRFPCMMPCSKHLPQIVIPNHPLRRPRSNNHIIPQQPQPKPSLTVLEIIQPLPPKRLDLDVRRSRVRRAIFALDPTLPIAQEVVAPDEEGFAVVGADVQQ